MPKLTDKQKRIILIVGAALVAIHFAPSFFSMFNPLASHAAPAKPSPVHIVPVSPPAPQATQPSPEAIAATKYTGIWVGDALMPNQYRCNIRLEIRVVDDPTKKLKGYEQKSCVPLQPFQGGSIKKGSVADIMRDTAPISSVLTGTPHEGGLTFTVDQIIGTPPDGCLLNGFALTDFGQGQEMAQWQEDKCAGGKMILRKARG